MACSLDALGKVFGDGWLEGARRVWSVPLRRLMRNCGRRGRSRNLMLAPNLLPKAVPHSGSRLLLGLIVRPDRRLVEGRPPLGHTPPRPSRPPERPGGPDAGDPRPVAALSQRARLLALRVGAPAPLLPYVVLPRPTQPPRPSPGARVAPLAAGFRRGSYGTFGGLPRDGHYPHPGHREGEGFSQGAFRRPSKLRTQRLQDRVGIRLQGGPRGGPRGRDHRFRAAVAASDEGPIGDALIASDRHGAYLADKGFTGLEWERLWMELYGALVAAAPKNDSRRAWSKADRRWASGKRQIIEGVIGQLKDFFSLERHRAKTLGGLLRRLAAKVAAYTCAQQINDSLGRPLRHLADLLV